VQRPVTVRLHPQQDISRLAAIWSDLESRYGRGGVATSWDWTEAWIRHYGLPHRFAVGYLGDAPCAVALVVRGAPRRLGPFAWRSLHLGTAGERDADSVCVEYNRVLADPDHRAGFAAALLEALEADPDWDELALDGFVPDDAAPFLQAAPAFAVERRLCRVMDLRGAGKSDEEILSRFSPSARKRVRNNLRDYGSVRAEWPDRPAEALGIFEEMAALHQKRWNEAGKPGAFASPRFTAFHREIVERLVPKRRAFLFRARTETGTIGCLYGFIENQRVFIYQLGMAASSGKGTSPGLAAHLCCMKSCAERGIVEYNLMAGDSRYKQELSNSSEELLWATLRRPRLVFRLIDGLRSVKRWARRAAAPAPAGA
jgi:CelD/BcsL family acetyltransferase involved in cellulose biosynthesis